LLTLVFSILGVLLHRATQRLNQQEHTRVKANLCFDDLVERKPEIQRHYDAVMTKNGS
jgi:hypothetical protein